MNIVSNFYSAFRCIDRFRNFAKNPRHLSTFSAIGKALRQSKQPLRSTTRGRLSNPRQSNRLDRPSKSIKLPSASDSNDSRNARGKRFGRGKEGERTKVTSDALKTGQAYRRDNDHRVRSLPGERNALQQPIMDKQSDSYWSMPYTTAASDFLFGYSTVKAALKVQKRQFYKLYLHERALRRDSENGFSSILNAAKRSNVAIQHVDDRFLGVMDKKSNNRPHNGVILEASPLPVLPIVHLSAVARHDKEFAVEMDFQSAEEKAVNGTNAHISCDAAHWRNPVVLFLHEIQNEGNMGAIIRTAYYLGVDAVAVHDRSTASVSAGSTLKASSGAIEAMPILRVGNIDSFLSKSAEAGWRIFASVAPSAASTSNNNRRRVELAANSDSPLGFLSGKDSWKDNDIDSDSETFATELEHVNHSAQGVHNHHFETKPKCNDDTRSTGPQFSDSTGNLSTRQLLEENSGTESDSCAFASTLGPSDPLSFSATNENDTYKPFSQPIPVSRPTVSVSSFLSPSPTFSRPIPLTHLGTPALQHPCLLILGSEHTGLSRRIISKCHVQTYIEAARAQDEVGVDSLNVSVAAALLMQRFVQRPKRRVRVGLGGMLG